MYVSGPGLCRVVIRRDIDSKWLDLWSIRESGSDSCLRVTLVIAVILAVIAAL